MNELQVFKSQEFGTIRTTVIDGEPWFVVSDVCDYFGVTNRNRVMQRIDDCDKGGTRMNTPGGMQEVATVNESGLYSLLFALQPQEARGVSKEYIEERMNKVKSFKRWVTHDVLPTIRKTGGYVNDDSAFVETYLPFADEATKQMFRSTLETIRQQNAKIEADKPKVLFADAVSTAKSSILIGELAKLLKQNGVDIGQNRLFDYLRKHGYLISRQGSDYNMPTQRSMERGWFEIKETAITHSDGSISVSKTVKVTGKGQQYFVNHFLAN